MTTSNITIAEVHHRSMAQVATDSWRKAWNMAPFLSFCWAGYFFIFGVCALGFYLIYPRLHEIHDYLVLAAAGIEGFFLFVLGGGLLLITITVITGMDLLYPHGKRSVTVTLLFPIAVFLAQFFRINRNTLRTSFVKVNNAMTIAQRKRILGDRILILLPHCLQIDVCNRKITGNIYNCVQCGRCRVGDLVGIGKRYDLKLEVVNGGTLARRVVKQMRPDGIVAVACERDLTLGIQDVYPIPVYGVINDRPNGPCLNTCVDMGLVEEGIRFFKKMPAEKALP